MTLTIELSPEEEARLAAQAHQQGQAIGDAARALVRSGLGIAQEPAITAAQQAALNQRLRDVGLLTEMPTRRLGPPPRVITVLGPPVSQTLLEDRE